MLLEHYGAGWLFCIFAVWDNSPWWQCAMVWGRFFAPSCWCTMVLVCSGAGALWCWRALVLVHHASGTPWCWSTMVLVHTVVLDGGLSLVLVRDGATRLRLGGGAPARKLEQPRQNYFEWEYGTKDDCSVEQNGKKK